MGYPNPEQIPLKEEIAFRGICVYVPDLPEYTRALLGSISGLGSWVVWERDGDHSAARSAELWRMANDLTLATWTDPCGCDEMNCDDLRDIIREELDSMTISIVNTNHNCCCGGSACGGPSQIDEPLPPGVEYPPLPTIPPGDDNPPVDPTLEPDYVSFSCNMSHYMFYLIRQSILAAVDANSSSLSFRYQLVKDALGFSVRPGGGVADIDYWQFMIVYFTRDAALDAIRQMELNYDDLICALSGSYSATERRDRFLSLIDGMAITDRQKRLIRYCMSGIEFHSWFNPHDFETVQAMLPASYTDRDCPCALGTGDETPDLLGDAPDGRKWVPITSNMGFTIGGMTYMGEGVWSAFMGATDKTLTFPGDMALTSGIYRANAFAMEIMGAPIEWYRLVAANHMNLPIGVNKYFAEGDGIVANIEGVPIVTGYQMETVNRGTRLVFSTVGGTVTLKLWAMVSTEFDANSFPHPDPV